MESIAHLRAKCQTVHSEDFSAQLVRAVSIYLTWLLIPTGISANAVSLLNVLVGVSAGVAFAFSSASAVIVGTVLFTLNSILDGVDGEIARYYQRSSLTGLFVDRINSIFAYPFLFGGMGFGLMSSYNNLTLAAFTLLAVWACIAMRLAKTSVDTTLVDAMTMSKARQETETETHQGEYVPMSESVRRRGRLLWLLDFVTIRQPGFNIVLILAAALQLLLPTDFVTNTWRDPFSWFIVGYSLVYTLGTLYAIWHVIASRRIEKTLEHLRRQFVQEREKPI